MTIQLPPREERESLESDISKRILAAANAIPGVRLTRNNSGKSPRPCGPCAAKLCQGCRGRLMRPISFGLGEGSTDLVGVVTFGGEQSCDRELVDIAPIAVAFGVEVKRPNAKKQRHEAEQFRWRAALERRGMLSTIQTSDVDAATWIRCLVIELADRMREIVRGPT